MLRHCFYSSSFHILYIGLKAAIALEELVDLRATTEDFKYEPHTVNIRFVLIHFVFQI